MKKYKRVNLINQNLIRALINLQDRKHYENTIEILEKGYTTLYSAIEGKLRKEMAINKQVLVLDVLSLYNDIEHFKAKNTENKIGNHLWGSFRGFDENDEIEYLLFAKFLLYKQKKFQTVLKASDRNNDFNAHMPTLDIYEDMIRKWKTIKSKRELKEEEILWILGE